MAIDFSKLITSKATTSIEHDGMTANITFNPGVLTTERIEKMSAEDADEDGFISMLSELVIDWDIKNGTRKWPCTEENMKKLPLFFVRMMFRAVMDAAGGDDEGEAAKV